MDSNIVVNRNKLSGSSTAQILTDCQHICRRQESSRRILHSLKRKVCKRYQTADQSSDRHCRNLSDRATSFSQRAAGETIQYCFSLIPGATTSRLIQQRFGHALMQSLFFDGSKHKRNMDGSLSISWPSNLDTAENGNIPFSASSASLASNSHKFATGMFNSIECMLADSNPVRLTVFLNFLLSNTDRANILLFYIITSDYLQKKADRVDLQRWAYEIHSTFTLDDGSPLFINISDVDQHQISRVLQGAELTKVDESNLRHVFDRCREVCKACIEDQLLADFRHQQELGITSMYGDECLADDSDRCQQLAFVESLILPYLQKWREPDGGSEIENRLLSSCLATYLRRYDIKRSPRFDLSEIDIFLRRERTLFQKGKDFSRKLNQRNKQFAAGHCLTTRHFIKPTQCSLCSRFLFGIAPQGYFCLNCGMCFDEDCVVNGNLEKADISFKCNRHSKMGKAGTKLFGRYYGATPQTSSICSIEGRHSFSNSSRDSLRSDLTNVHRSKSDRWPRDKIGSPTRLTQFYVDGKCSSGSVMDDSEQTSLPGQTGDKANLNVSKSDYSSQTSSTENHIIHSPSNVGSATSVNDTEFECSDVCTDVEAFADDSDVDLDSNHLPPFDSIAQLDEMKSFSDCQLRRHAALLELYHTERTHLRSLKILKNIFRDRMHQFQCISKKELDVIFPNLDELIEIHTSIKHALRERYKQNVGQACFSIADVLLEHFSGPRGQRLANECARFISQQQTAMSIIRRKEMVPEFAHFLRVAEMNPICRKLGLKDYLPCVMSRVPKYKLMFEQLWKFTEDGEEKSNLARCVEAAVELSTIINESVRSQELQQTIVKIEKNLFINMPDCDDLTYDIRKGEFDFESRQLVYNSLLTLEWPLKEVEFEACLFSDALVLFQRIPLTSFAGSEYRYVLQNLKTKKENADLEIIVCPYMPIDQFMLKKKAGLDNRAFFLVSKGKCRQFLIELRARSKEERDRWFNHVAQCQERAERGPNDISDFDGRGKSMNAFAGEAYFPTDLSQPDMKADESVEIVVPDFVEEASAGDSSWGDLSAAVESIADTHGRMKDLMETWPVNLHDAQAAEAFFNLLYQQVLQMDSQLEDVKKCMLNAEKCCVTLSPARELNEDDRLQETRAFEKKSLSSQSSRSSEPAICESGGKRPVQRKSSALN